MNTCKRLLSSLLVMVILVSQITLVNVFAAEASLSVNVAGRAKIGDEVKCTVEISGNSGWGALQFRINYNKAVLEYVSDTKGSALASAATSINYYDGYINVVAYTDSDNIKENGSIIEVTFKAVATGTSDLTLELSDYYDVDVNVMPCNLNNGSITVEGDTPSMTETSTETTTVTTTEISTQSTTTEKQTEATTKAPVTTTEKQTEATTKAPVTTTEKQTESTTKAPVTTTENTTKATTNTVTTESSSETTTKRISSGSRGGGAGVSSVKTSTSTTTTTEVTTETTTKTVTSEQATETTTEKEVSVNDVKVTIGNKTVVIGDESYEVDAAPYIQAISNSTLVPLRFVALAIACGDIDDADNNESIIWDSVTKTATIIFDGKTIEFTAESDTMVIDGKLQTMENGVKAEITDGRMFVPFRALGNALDVNVEWEPNTKTAVYKIK